MKLEELAFQKGYRVIDGEVYSRNGNKLKSFIKQGYRRFSLVIGSRTDATRKVHSVGYHRLVAYQKYGEELYGEGIEVRHRDGNSLNNQEDNILIGTHSSNMMDKKPEIRLSASVKASTELRVYSDSQIAEIRAARKRGLSYSQLAEEFMLSGKGHAYYIVNNEYKTVKG